MVSRKLKLVILPTAKADLRDIVNFIAQGSVKYAQLEKALVINIINKLYDNPYLGKRFEYKGIEARQLVFRNYLIIYRFKSDSIIEILTIHHHARSLAGNSAFGDED